MNTRRIVITGAGGFLGNEILRRAISLKQPTSFVAVSSKKVSSQDIDEGASFACVDPESILKKGVLRKGDVLLNCAFPRSEDGFTLASGLDYLDRLFQSASEARISCFINVSSQSVYDPHRIRPALESDVLCLATSYAVAKRASEQLLDSRCVDIPHTHIRLASLLGPRFGQRMPNKMIEDAWTSGRVTAYMNNSVFGYMDVRDAAGALLDLALSHDLDRVPMVMNVGPDSACSVSEIAECIKRSFKRWRDADVLVVEKADRRDPVNSSIDSTLFHSVSAWRNGYSLQETIDAIVQHSASAREGGNGE